MNDRDQVLRRLVFLFGGLETIAIMVVVGLVIASGQLTSGEQLSRELGWGALMIFGLPYLASVVPALLFAIMHRRLPLALALCALFPVLAYLAFVYA
jgi:hypothetical protein